MAVSIVEDEVKDKVKNVIAVVTSDDREPET